MIESQKSESQEGIKPKVIIEIGPQTCPIYIGSREIEQQIKDGASYIGIDVSEEDLRTVNRERVGRAIAADLAKLPLRDNSVDQMWMLNVMGDR